MNKIPRFYYRIKNFRRNYLAFQKLSALYSRNALKTPELRQDMLNVIKSCWGVYWKILRDFLQDRNINLYLPREIFIAAEKEKIIDDAKVWISYIDDLNALLKTEDSVEKKYIVNKIFHDYRKPLEKVKKFLDLYFAKFHISEQILPFVPESLPDNNPVYSGDYIGLSKESYNLLLDFFKHTSEIKNVWVHGSRAFGNPRISADIDLIVDSPLNSFERLQNSFSKIQIPQNIDCTNVHDKENNDFLYTLIQRSKKIYRAADFGKNRII